jgi:hypothetical protein
VRSLSSDHLYKVHLSGVSEPNRVFAARCCKIALVKLKTSEIVQQPAAQLPDCDDAENRPHHLYLGEPMPVV